MVSSRPTGRFSTSAEPSGWRRIPTSPLPSERLPRGTSGFSSSQVEGSPILLLGSVEPAELQPVNTAHRAITLATRPTPARCRPRSFLADKIFRLSTATRLGYFKLCHSAPHGLPPPSVLSDLARQNRTLRSREGNLPRTITVRQSEVDPIQRAHEAIVRPEEGLLVVLDLQEPALRRGPGRVA